MGLLLRREGCRVERMDGRRGHRVVVLGVLLSALGACPRLGPAQKGDSCKVHSDCDTELVCAGGKCGSPWARRWRLTLESAHISQKDPSGGDWDGDGSPPDPFITVTADNSEVLRTQRQNNTFTPAWGESINVFLNNNTMVQISLWDDDLLSILPQGVAETRNQPLAYDELRQGEVTVYAFTGKLGDGGTGTGAQTTTTITYRWELEN